MEVLNLEPYPKRYRFKLRKLSKEEEELEFWKQSYEMMKNNKQKYINSALRKVRLSQLFDFIKTQQIKDKKKKNKIIKPIEKLQSSTDLLRSQWSEARKKGNEYSTMNKLNLYETPRRWSCKGTQSEMLHKEQRVQSARTYGNICSRMNVEKLKFAQHRSSRILRPMDKLTKRRRILMEYGSYYSMRNKLFFKDSQGEFDNEYQDLLLKCVSFEREHLNVRGFLEEKFYTNLNFQRGILAFAYQENQREKARVQRRLEREACAQLIQAKKTEPKLPEEQHSLGENEDIKSDVTKNDTDITEEKVRTTLSVQNDMDANTKIAPNKEEFPSVTRISKSMPEVLCEQTKPETILSTIKYENSRNFASDFSNDASNKNSTESTKSWEKIDKLRENFTNLSGAVLNGKSFENAILEITANFKCPNSERTQMEQLLKDLFLAFGLNLVKSTVEDDVVKRDIDMDAVRNKAAKQAEAISQVLDKVFRPS